MYTGFFRSLFERGPRVAFPIRSLVGFSVSAVSIGTFTLLIFLVDRLLVAHFRSATEVGIYQAASQCSVLFTIILTCFSSILFPMIGAAYARKENQVLAELYRVSTKWALYLSLPMFLTICFASRDLMTVMYGRIYAAGAMPAVILAFGQLVNVGTGAGISILLMTGQQRRSAQIGAIVLVADIALNWIAIPRLGITGAALSAACAACALSIAYLFQVGWTLRLWPYDPRFLKGAIATLICIAALCAVHLFGPTAPLARLAAKSAVSIVAFGGSLLAMGLDAEDYEVLGLIEKTAPGLVGRFAARHRLRGQ